ncbi:olfactory receptor 13C8 [Xenopus laevis]|uniref:Olfactory receptor n=2 Tax=Xenopus laevis TaxID=8355 RepID=A0A974CT37_XENLA|nr:olfactory receptor 13C8 [Xenopus laevis]OCT79164.1 hypothetical protein XELAEV_18030263mg [Xenopus laevis]
MESTNQTVIQEFIFIGLSRNQTIKTLLFALFFPVYIFTIFGNGILIFIIARSSNIHTPMYYFLCNLAFLDTVFSTSTVPKLLVDLLLVEGRISYVGCMIQMCIGLFLGQTECILLAVMACDRFVAICVPLRYSVIMSWKCCKCVTAVTWVLSFLSSILPILSKPVLFCRENKLNHFVCELLAVVKLACGDTLFYERAITLTSIFSTLVPFSFIVVSYIYILKSVLQIRSTEGRTKAFSTCASHLTVVIMFYGPSMTLYLGPSGYFSFSQKYLSLFYGVLTPMLNPLIYSLRNDEVRKAIRKTLIFSS